MDALSGWSNETVQDVKHVLQHHHKSSLARFLFSFDSVNKVYTPILLLFGAIGNCLSVTVFCRAPSHRHLSSSYYLSALAISDIGYLINLLAVWLEDMGFRVITSALTCPLVMYLGQVTCFLSVWLTVSFTVERFFAVCYPLTRPTVCTVARAKKAITILTIISLLGFSYVWIIARVVNFPLFPPTPPLQDDSNDELIDILDSTDLANSSFLTSCNYSDVWQKFSRGTSTGDPLILCLNGKNSTFSTKSETSSLTSSSSPNILVMSSKNLSFYDGFKNTSDDESEHIGSRTGETVAVCYVREDYLYFTSIASHIDSLLTLIVPFFIISCLNVKIAVCVWKLKDQRQNIVAVAKISTSAYQQNQGQQQQQQQQQQLLQVNQQQQQQQMSDHPSSSSIATNTTTCRLTVSRSSPVLNGGILLGSQPSPTSGGTTSLANSKSYRINLTSSTTSLNTNLTNVNGPSSSRLNRNHHHSSSTSASEARVTKTLLLVSTVFLVLNLPAHAIRALAYIRSLWGLEMLEELQAAQAWANILFNTNFSCNFLLYCMSGRTFRKSLWSICFKSSSSSSSSRQTKSGNSTKKNLLMLQQNNRSNHHHHRQQQQQQLQQQHLYNRPYTPNRMEDETEQSHITIIT